MKTEQEIRDWAVELRHDFDGHNDIAAINVGTKAALDAIAWILGDTPASDLARVKAVLAETFDEISAELFMLTPNDAFRGMLPLQYIVTGRADELIAFLRKPVPTDA